ncbi:MAG: prenyltransferase/squalene oxidase repeat-containing protein [Pirellulales bacterium]
MNPVEEQKRAQQQRKERAAERRQAIMDRWKQRGTNVIVWLCFAAFVVLMATSVLIDWVPTKRPPKPTVSTRPQAAEPEPSPISQLQNSTTGDTVALGLAWLTDQQRDDGSWSLKGPYPDGSNDDENVVSATAMAMRAFMHAGVTHETDTGYGRRLKHALAYLLGKQEPNGEFWDAASAPLTRQYAHAQATIVTAGLYAMTGDEQLREPARRAVDFCVTAQDPVYGGWRYTPGRAEHSDVSVTGWVLTALRIADTSGLEVPDKTLDAADTFLDSAATKPNRPLETNSYLLGSRYGYMPGYDVPSPSVTAEALLCRQYLGWNDDDPRMDAGLEYISLVEYSPDWSKNRDVYFWYYATQALQNVGGPRCQKWNEVIHELLDDHQTKTGAQGKLAPAQTGTRLLGVRWWASLRDLP